MKMKEVAMCISLLSIVCVMMGYSSKEEENQETNKTESEVVEESTVNSLSEKTWQPSMENLTDIWRTY